MLKDLFGGTSSLVGNTPAYSYCQSQAQVICTAILVKCFVYLWQNFQDDEQQQPYKDETAQVNDAFRSYGDGGLNFLDFISNEYIECS